MALPSIIITEVAPGPRGNSTSWFIWKGREPYHPSKKEYDHLVQNYGFRFMAIEAGPDCMNCSPALMAKKLILDRATVEEIRKEAGNDGMTVLLQEGIHRIVDGVTDFNQVMSVSSRDS